VRFAIHQSESKSTVPWTIQQLHRPLNPFYSCTPPLQQSHATISKENEGPTSAALPTIGRTINPINACDTPEDATIASIELTRNSAQTATIAVDTNNNPIAQNGVISAISSGSSVSESDVGSSYKYACDFNWKNRYLHQRQIGRRYEK
jgi:hypothetical protein